MYDCLVIQPYLKLFYGLNTFAPIKFDTLEIKLDDVQVHFCRMQLFSFLSTSINHLQDAIFYFVVLRKIAKIDSPSDSPEREEVPTGESCERGKVLSAGN